VLHNGRLTACVFQGTVLCFSHLLHFVRTKSCVYFIQIIFNVCMVFQAVFLYYFCFISPWTKIGVLYGHSVRIRDFDINDSFVGQN
jgi:hypothetical protein